MKEVRKIFSSINKITEKKNKLQNMNLFWTIVWAVVVALVILAIIGFILGLLGFHVLSNKLQPYVNQARSSLRSS